MLCHLIAGVVYKGFFGDNTVDCRITDSGYVTLCIVGKVGRITVSVSHLSRLVKAVVGLDYRITLRIGLLDNVVAVIILVGLNVSVFVRMLDQQTVAIVYAAAGLAVSVGGNSGISLATFASIVAVIEVRSVIQRILLSKNTTVIVIGVLKVTDTLGVRAGNNSLIIIILISERIAVHILDRSEKVIRIGENCYSFCIIIHTNYLTGGILLKIHLFAGYTVSDSNQGIGVGDESFKALVINDLGKITVSIVIFGSCGVAVNDVRILARMIHGQYITVLVRAATSESGVAIAVCCIAREDRRIVVNKGFAILNFDVLLKVVIPTSTEHTTGKLCRIIVSYELNALTAEQRHNGIVKHMGAGVNVNGIGKGTALNLA